MREAARRHGIAHVRTPLDMGSALVLAGVSLLVDSAAKDPTGEVRGFVIELLEMCAKSADKEMTEQLQKHRQ